ncbi:SGNH/GDSL hydrolase family protein [Actinophytocola xanthii]|uniref:SGNH hydrolase n=1 Tax=Actinophytocola xanthii TaxID=1912961 RepID=A0A1Q8CUW8_9PSEU|nr:SGNH/GDSL hydrolase family protein [Actinophytocola xanthii]OLF18124.1 SGNH hydrolase [Actinophytocola xanthii]
MSNFLRFRVLGDSLAAGVGCVRAEQSLGYLLTETLRAAGHQVQLSVHAVPGARSTDLAPQVRAALRAGVDLALVVIGANDLTSFTPPAVGARLLGEAVTDLRAAGGRVFVIPAPDLGLVSHVPPAFRQFVSQASHAYALAQTDAVRRAGGTVAEIDPGLLQRFAADLDLFSADRFHPSPAGYALIAEAVAPALRAEVTERAG